MINIKSLQYTYRKQGNLFRQLDLDIKQGGIYGLVGKNGAGKSTLLKLLAGLIFPKAGKVSVMERQPQDREVVFLQQVYFIPEEFDVPTMTIQQYLDLYSNLYPQFDRNMFKLISTECGLTFDMNLSELSHGNKKKFFICFGLATNCQLLLMDEPTNGLDIPAKKQFKQIMANYISDDRVVIIATHQVHDIETLIDHVFMLNNGQVVFNESMAAINDKIIFSQMMEEPQASEALYYEKMMGGYLVVQERGQQHETEVNLEALFNAILSNHGRIQHVFGA